MRNLTRICELATKMDTEICRLTYHRKALMDTVDMQEIEYHRACIKESNEILDRLEWQYVMHIKEGVA